MHPAVASWFEATFPGGPTKPQQAAWPLIASGTDVLVASPTGTGKTLTGFLMAIDRALCVPSGDEARLPRVVYVSPLRALAVDVKENLEAPLAGIREHADRLGMEVPELTVGVRTGDTTPGERAAMRRHPPDLLVTTPESLYLLLSSPGGRAILTGVESVIVDEIHAVARDKRGAHLALSLERLSLLVAGEGRRLQRIGLSATVRPLELVARLLSGVGADREAPQIVDCGLRRDFEVSIEIPAAELEAVSSGTQFADVLDQIADEVRRHRTTLVFVNTRKLAERVAHQLSLRLAEDGDGDGGGEDITVAAHHGSLSFARRRIVEDRLRRGELRALVATASLELGIDVGPIELVCQIGSPRAIGTFLQRLGRANHSLGGIPKARLFALTRDELVECVAIVVALAKGSLDVLSLPDAPIDILAQQIVAEVAARVDDDGCPEDDLFEMARAAAPYGSLTRSEFDGVVELVSRGVTTGRGRRGAHVHRDGVHHVLRARRGARLAALTGGGAIPDTGDYRVVLDPDGVTVGSVHEDFAVEANIGDVFLLGTHSWRVAKVEVGTVRVIDAGTMAPTIPFWLGEAPARTAELSAEVSAVRALVESGLDAGGSVAAVEALIEATGVGRVVAEQVVSYLEAGRRQLGVLPTTETLVVERFFDDTEGAALVVHSPYGGRINRALGLALRKRFCVSFDFELQAAADDDTVVLSVGPTHSFPLGDALGMLPSSKVEDVLTQAILTHPMLRARWRWNCTRALVVARSMAGKPRPIHLQRMDADDVMAAAWPNLAACQENAPAGPIAVSDHPLARQTVKDCLSEALDVDGLARVLRDVEAGVVRVHLVESAEPSVMAHGILSGRPYTFLDDAPLEERRTRAVAVRRGLPVPGTELAALDPAAIETVMATARPVPRNIDELHDLLLSTVLMRPVPEWRALFEQLCGAGRADVIPGGLWVATEMIEESSSVDQNDVAAAACLRGHLELAGPVTLEDLVGDAPMTGGLLRGAPLTAGRARTAVARLVEEGSAIELADGRWCIRHLLVRIHAIARRTRRQNFGEAVNIGDFVKFLVAWQGVAPGWRHEGRRGLLDAIGTLSGIEAAGGEWERSILPARVRGYEGRWLDELCLSGDIAWCRLSPRPDADQVDGNGDADQPRRGAASPSSATPLAIVLREDLPWLLAAVRLGEPASVPRAGVSAEILDVLSAGGARFRPELGPLLKRLPDEIDEGLWDLVSRGLVTADAFSAVRSLLARRRTGRARARPRSRRWSGPVSLRGPGATGLGEGRWSRLPDAAVDDVDIEDLAERVADLLLARWGVVMWEVWARESFRVPWREVVRALRRFEARGIAVGGRFVAGLSGEQFSTEDALERLRRNSCQSGSGEEGSLAVSACDPLNLTGTLIPGPRIPSIVGRRVLVRGGTLIAEEAAWT